MAPGIAENGYPCYTESCDCHFVFLVGTTPPRYTEDDGVIDWRCCLDEDRNLNIRVRGTHAGLAFNSEVYRAVTHLLAGEPLPRRPTRRL
jgi:hypothetical protein